MAYSRHGVTSVATKFLAVTPDDDTPVPAGAVGIYVGGGGDVSVVDRDGVTTVFEDVVAGSLLPISPRIIAEASTATSMVLLY